MRCWWGSDEDTGWLTEWAVQWWGAKGWKYARVIGRVRLTARFHTPSYARCVPLRVHCHPTQEEEWGGHQHVCARRRLDRWPALGQPGVAVDLVPICKRQLSVYRFLHLLRRATDICRDVTESAGLFVPC